MHIQGKTTLKITYVHSYLTEILGATVELEYKCTLKGILFIYHMVLGLF